MTIDRNSVIKIPTWLIAIALPMVISILTAVIITNASNAATRKQVEINTEEIKNRVNRAEFEIIREQLNRIEGKLDNHLKEK